mgnify:CR=1 FL=1
MKIKFLLVLGICLFTNSAKASLISGYSYTHDPASWFTGGNYATSGFRFQANQDLYVSALGFVDARAPGLNASHEIGIWNDVGNLLASTTVAAGEVAPLIDGFRYSDIPLLSLLAGEIYRIAAIGFGDSTISKPTRSAASEITLLDAGRQVHAPPASDRGLNFPTLFSGPESALANFLFSTIPPSTGNPPNSVPAPGSLAIILIGFVFIGLFKRKKNTY